MTCKDCVHYDVCKEQDAMLGENKIDEIVGVENHCEFFKLQSRFVELPCEVGQTVYEIVGETIKKRTVEQIFIGKDESESFVYATTISGGVLDYMFYEFGWYVFPSRKEAEKALAERRKK